MIPLSQCNPVQSYYMAKQTIRNISTVLVNGGTNIDNIPINAIFPYLKKPYHIFAIIIIADASLYVYANRSQRFLFNFSLPSLQYHRYPDLSKFFISAQRDPDMWA